MTGKRFSPRNPQALLVQAQQLIYQAWDTPNLKRRTALALRTLAISADCVDAYIILAETTIPVGHALELYRKAVEAGERSLGKKVFKQELGHFWHILETRPYMRARAGLARCLWQSNQRDAALEHYCDLLRLNPNDNQGIRYILVSCLLELGHDEEVAALLEYYPEDIAATWPWTAALLAFRKQGDNPHSRSRLAAALQVNPHVPVFLLSHKKLPRTLPDLIGFGDQSEAICYALENLKAWQATTGALAWLAGQINAGTPAILH